jgi:hypothetical protein
MTETRRRTAALLFTALMAVAGAFAVSATFAADDAHAFKQGGQTTNGDG